MKALEYLSYIKICQHNKVDKIIYKKVIKKETNNLKLKTTIFI